MISKSSSDQELLRMLMRDINMNIDKLFVKFGELAKIIYNVTKEELMEENGVGYKRAVQILNIKEFSNCLDCISWKYSNYCIHSARDVTTILKDMCYLQQEEFRTILLDSKNHILHVDYTSKGILDAILVHPREVFCEAIKRRCSSIIIAHNHPSGDVTPSERDKQVTERLAMVGDIVGIPVLDHIILGQGYYSFKEKGLINHEKREVYTD